MNNEPTNLGFFLFKTWFVFVVCCCWCLVFEIRSSSIAAVPNQQTIFFFSFLFQFISLSTHAAPQGQQELLRKETILLILKKNKDERRSQV
jgi:hypothetical protein